MLMWKIWTHTRTQVYTTPGVYDIPPISQFWSMSVVISHLRSLSLSVASERSFGGPARSRPACTPWWESEGPGGSEWPGVAESGRKRQPRIPPHELQSMIDFFTDPEPDVKHSTIVKKAREACKAAGLLEQSDGGKLDATPQELDAAPQDPLPCVNAAPQVPLSSESDLDEDSMPLINCRSTDGRKDKKKDKHAEKDNEEKNEKKGQKGEEVEEG